MFVTVVEKAVAQVPEANKKGDKVFILDAYEALEALYPNHSMSLDVFKEKLVEANRRRELDLVRADMAFAYDQEVVSQSFTTDGLESQFHFVRLAK